MLTKIKTIHEIEYSKKSIEFNNELNLYTDYYKGKILSEWLKDDEIEIEINGSILWPYRIKNRRNNQIIECRKIKNSNLIPKDKFDVASIEKMKLAPKEKVLEILEELFDWILDCNLPIAKPLSEYLATLGENIIPFISFIIGEPKIEVDEKISVFYFILPKLDKDLLILIRESLERIAIKPTEIEKEMEFYIEAEKCLNKTKNI